MKQGSPTPTVTPTKSTKYRVGQKGVLLLCYPERKSCECLVQRKSFYYLISRIYVTKGIKNIFRKLMLDSSFFIVSAFKDIFSYPNVLMYSCLLNLHQ
jgi:hypothetical protein